MNFADKLPCLKIIMDTYIITYILKLLA